MAASQTIILKHQSQFDGAQTYQTYHQKNQVASPWRKFLILGMSLTKNGEC